MADQFYPTLIPTPFASAGEFAEIPLDQAKAGNGRAAWSVGFGPENSQKLPPQGQGKVVSRLDMNGVLNAISGVCYYAQSGGIFQYNAALAYQANKALIYHEGQLYICIQDNNADNPIPPGTNTAYWLPLLSFLQGNASNVGNIVYRASLNLPSTMVICNGAEYSREAYKALFDDIGVTYGEGDGKTTFNVPDLRGVYIRGADLGRGLDPDRQIGSYQEDAMQRMTGSVGIFNNYAAFLGTPEGPFYKEEYGPQIGIKATSSTDKWIEVKYDTSLQARTADETRVKNVALVPCIYYA